MDHHDDAERLLRAATPAPTQGFVRDLEARLQSSRSPRPALRWLSPVLAGGGLAAVLATVGLGISLAGIGPLASQSGETVEAEDRCRTEMVVRKERRPVLVTDRTGETRIEKRLETVRRPVKRCD